jgi:MFS transporter, DHA2 family, multidrug resistance protein
VSDLCVIDPPASGNNRRAMIAIMLAVALASLDTAIANTALPAIAANLHCTPAQSVWVVNAYQLAMIATILPFAALGDSLGHRRVYLFGLAVFTVSSLACALAPTLAALAVARVVQGIGASAITSISIALVRSLYPDHRLGRGMGVNTLVVGVSVAIGPTLASMILAIGSWPWLFLVNVPLGFLALAFAWPALPHTERGTQAFDRVAALLNVVAFAALIFALGETAQQASTARVFIAMAVALGFGIALARREAQRAAPMLPVDLLRRPVFALSAMTAVCAFAAQGLAFVSLPFYFVDVLHRSQVEAGLLMTPWPVAVALFAPFAGRLSDRYPPGALGAIGLAVMSGGLISLALLPGELRFAALELRMVVCGIGFGLFQSPNLKAFVTSAPAARSGGASGAAAISRLLGQATGAALAALALSVAGDRATMLALICGTTCAGVAGIASGLRLLGPFLHQS